MALIVANKNANLNDKYLRIFVNQFKNTGAISGDKRTFLQDGLLACIHVIRSYLLATHSI